MFFKTLLTSFVLASAVVHALPSLSVSLSGPSSVGKVDDFKVEATITNTGNETVKLLDDPRTLASSSPVDKFSIVHANGGRPSFTGIMVKYSPEIAARSGGYTILAPGDSIKVVHNLFEAYNFTDPGVGSYNFVPDSSFYFVDEKHEIGVVQAVPNAYTAQVDGPTLAVARSDEHSSGNLSKRAVFVGCTARMRSTILVAAAYAEVYAANAKAYLTTHTTSTPRFTSWFGTFTPAHRATVLSHFTGIDANIFSTYTYDCTCTLTGYYAYVYPNRFGKVFFCAAFWDAPYTGTDSKAGIIIHEASHFIVNGGGTDDFSYGQTRTRNLARVYPNQAILNAASHEYFAENSPAERKPEI